MINRGGEKVAPDEVDAAIAAHPAVLEAVAFAVPHPTLGEDVACAVVLRKGNGAQVTARELRALCVNAAGAIQGSSPHLLRRPDPSRRTRKAAAWTAC